MKRYDRYLHTKLIELLDMCGFKFIDKECNPDEYEPGLVEFKFQKGSAIFKHSFIAYEQDRFNYQLSVIDICLFNSNTDIEQVHPESIYHTIGSTTESVKNRSLEYVLTELFTKEIREYKLNQIL